MVSGTRFAEIRGMAKPNRNPTASFPRTPTDRPSADRTATSEERGILDSPDDEITAAEDEDDDEFEDVDVDEEDAELEDEDEGLEGR